MQAVEELRLFEFASDPVPAFRNGSPKGARRSVAADLAEAARLLRQSQIGFASAVLEARQRGLSWRRIGVECGLPFQTLHRRFGEPQPRRKRSHARS